MAIKTRKAAVAGYFYPANKAQLAREISGFLDQVPDQHGDGALRGLIVPHAGYRYSGQIAAYAYALLRANPGRWKKIVAIGPAHTLLTHRLAADPNDYWETPMGKVKILHDGFPVQEAAHIQEHCLEVQLPFLQHVLGDFRFLPLIGGRIDPRACCHAIESALDEESLLLISSDLSHYYDYETASKLDQATCRAIEELDVEFMERHGVACGKIPILIVMEIARRNGWSCRLLQYRNSGDVSRDQESVVGYGSFAFFQTKKEVIPKPRQPAS